MAILKQEDIFAKMNELTAGNSSEDIVTFYSDLKETLEQNNDSAVTSAVEENDNKWREKIKEMFVTGAPAEEQKPKEPESPVKSTEEEQITYEDLFKEE